jgi:hypothetical protein
LPPHSGDVRYTLFGDDELPISMACILSIIIFGKDNERVTVLDKQFNHRQSADEQLVFAIWGLFGHK